MNRRAFFRAIGIGIGSVAAAPLLKYVVLAPIKTMGLRWVQQYDISALPITRMDVIYGFANIRPDLALRAEDRYDPDGKFIA